MVFAAASLKNALDEIEIAWMRETGKKATIVYAASNMLAKQIEAGAPADLFVSGGSRLDGICGIDEGDSTWRVASTCLAIRWC